MEIRLNQKSWRYTRAIMRAAKGTGIIVLVLLLGTLVAVLAVGVGTKETSSSAQPQTQPPPLAISTRNDPNRDLKAVEREIQDNLSRLRQAKGEAETAQFATQIDGLANVAAVIHDASFQRCEGPPYSTFTKQCMMVAAVDSYLRSPRYLLDNIHSQTPDQLRKVTVEFIASFDEQNERVLLNLAGYTSTPTAIRRYHDDPRQLQEMLDRGHKFRARAESELDSNPIGAYIDIHTASLVNSAVAAGLSQYVNDRDKR